MPTKSWEESISSVQLTSAGLSAPRAASLMRRLQMTSVFFGPSAAHEADTWVAFTAGGRMGHGEAR